MFIGGHNGVRNKIAFNWNIANMNIVVGKGFLIYCPDLCDSSSPPAANLLALESSPGKDVAGLSRAVHLPEGLLPPAGQEPSGGQPELCHTQASAQEELCWRSGPQMVSGNWLSTHLR